MKFTKKWLFAMLAWILVLTLLPACAAEESTSTLNPPPAILPIPVEEVSLEEAEHIVGAPLEPKYLPPGYDFRRGFVRYHDSPGLARLTLYFSDKEMLNVRFH